MALPLVGLLLAGVSSGIYLSPEGSRVDIARQQPIPFSHQRHVQGNGIDCRYCHFSVETAFFAGIPPTETCMTCHSQVLTDQPMLEPVLESWRTGEPIAWARVHDLPDFVYFNHSVHVAQGVGCSTCHGRVDQMRLTHKENTLRMGWCLRCHKAPEKFIRPREEVFNGAWEAPKDQIARGQALVEAYDIKVGQLLNCSICHR
jgi:hypothetical protein